MRLDGRPADRLDVFDRCDEAGEELERLRPGLETVAERLVRLRSHLVRPPGLGDLPPRVRDSQVRPEELVRRADEDVDSPGGDVGRHVRGGVNGVGPGQRAGAVRQLHDPRDVGQRADGVRRDGEGDDAGARGKLCLEIGEIDVTFVGDVGEADLEAEVVGQLQPRGDVPVVVEARDDDLVSGFEPAARSAGERERQRGHVGAERHLVGRAAEEAAGGLARGIDDAHGPLAGLEGPADVRVGLAQIRGDGVDHLVGNLCPAGPVEQHEPALERAVAPADGLDVERRDAHACQH